ncbi:MAG: ABC transporter permease [Clostridia bacterium]|nr:ABC transporter permease [Clostridia bacterium]
MRAVLCGLIRRWKKNLLTLTGIAIGVCAVIVINTIGSGGTRAVSVSLQSMGLNGILVSHEDNSIPLTEQELQVLRRSGMVDYVMPVHIMMTTCIANEINRGNALLFGVDQGVSNVVSLRLREGRNLLQRDMDNQSAVCIIDESLLQRLDPNQPAVGQTVCIMVDGTEQSFQVVGVAESNAGWIQSMLGKLSPTFIYVPYTTLQTMTGSPLNQQVVVKTGSVPSGLDIEDHLEAVLQKYVRPVQSYSIDSLAQQQDSLYGILDMVTAVLTIIGSISLLVACLNIMTTMTVAVQERTREIGIKKAIGAGSGTILAEFLLESVILSVVGSLGGILVGNLITGFAGMQVEAGRCLVIAGITVFSGALFGICPALRAASMRPIDALKFH